MQIGTIRNQNGSIGEARTKSFLIDRFWILERSVDIDGADFIIQRRLYTHNILDKIPPRFGVVQSKYSQNDQTRHHLKKAYVIDKHGDPNLEFFLIVNIGNEDYQKLCLLSAKDIVDNFNTNEKNEYVIATSKVISHFEVKKKSMALDRIEYSIQHAEFYKNRLFVFKQLAAVFPDLDAISPEFRMGIDFVDGDITDLFKEQRQKAFEFLQEIETVHKLLTEYICETNPIEATILAESFNHSYQGSLSIPRIFDRDFYYKATSYLEQINSLKADDILDNFILLKDQIQTEIDSYLESNGNRLKPDHIHIIKITYEPSDLTILKISNDLIINTSLDSSDYMKFLKLIEGEIEISVNIGIDVKNNKSNYFFNEVCLIDILNKIYELKYFETN